MDCHKLALVFLCPRTDGETNVMQTSGFPDLRMSNRTVSVHKSDEIVAHSAFTMTTVGVSATTFKHGNPTRIGWAERNVSADVTV